MMWNSKIINKELYEYKDYDIYISYVLYIYTYILHIYDKLSEVDQQAIFNWQPLAKKMLIFFNGVSLGILS